MPNGPIPPYQTRRLRVRVRRDINIPTGAAVVLTFEGRTTDAQPGTPIPNTLITMTQNMPATGDLDFFLTDYSRIREIQSPAAGTPPQRPANRFARIEYMVNGVSAVTTVPVSLLNASLVYCETERAEPTP